MVMGGLDLSGLAFVMADTLVGSRRLWEAHDSIAAGVLWGCVTKKSDRRCSCWQAMKPWRLAQFGPATVT